MLARPPCPDVRQYASDRVFDGTRPLSADRVAKIKAHYYKKHTTPVVTYVVGTAKRIFRTFAIWSK
jgi:hypothetical protein